MPGEWHTYMEYLFPENMREVKFFCSSKNSNICRRADILLNNNRTVEIQNSYISEDEITQRFYDWNKFGKEIIWIINGNTYDIEYEELTSGYFLLIFNKPWKYKSFIPKYTNILLEADGKIFNIELKKVKSKMILLSAPKSINEIINHLTLNPENIWNIWESTNIVKPTLNIYQQGAGNGKTYGIWENICENHDKDTFIIVTKQHSAKNVIYEELNDQFQRNEFHIENMKNKHELNTKNHFVVKYTHKNSKRECIVLIGTIDSFCYNLSSHDKISANFFEGILNNINNNGCNKISEYGNMRFASQSIYVNKKTDIWIDEVQDLPTSYLYAFTRLILDTGCDVNIVGDKLQTLEHSSNFLTEIKNEGLPDINIVMKQEINKNRRIKVKGMHNIINDIINFKDYDLQEISCDKTHLEHTTDKPIEIINSPEILPSESDIKKIDNYVNFLIERVNHEVDTNIYVPNDFMFIFPIMKSNVLAVELEAKLQVYWMNKFNDTEYTNKLTNKFWKNHDTSTYTQYVHLHKHTEGTVINTKDSVNSTRLMSIRTSKGDGRNVVFILNTTEQSLKLVSNFKKKLLYESHLHVALTRAKKKIYFGLIKNNDDIHERFSNSEKIDNVEYLPHIDKTIEINKLLQYTNTEILKKMLQQNNIELQEFLKEKSNNIIREKVDWGYHCIKKCVYKAQVIFNILNNNDKSYNYNSSELFVVLNKISEIKIKKLNVNDYWLYLRQAYQKKVKDKIWLKVIPICILKESNNWSKYMKKIENTMLLIQRKIKSCEFDKMNIYENVVLIYMIDIYKNLIYATTVTPMDLYNITHYFDTIDKTKEKDLLLQLNSTASMIHDTFSNVEYYKKCRWNIEKSISLDRNRESFIINKFNYPIIGHNDDKIIHIMLESSFNQLNFWDVMIKCLIERFFIFNPDHEDNKKIFDGKDIETFLFILDEARCISIKWTWDKELFNDIIQEIKNSLEKHYQTFHKPLYKYFRFIKLNNKGNHFDLMKRKIQEKDTFKKYPPYIFDLLDSFEEKYREKNKEFLSKHCNKEETFCEILNNKLEKSLDDTFQQKIDIDFEY